jgi:hypothetical protein
MPHPHHLLLVSLLLLTALALPAGATETPVVPVGLDAYRRWEQWPVQRIGVRAYMRSTYDRAGGNEWADAAHFLYQLSEKENVTLDVAGRGVLYFARYNHWHGSPWTYEVDGTKHVVKESSTGVPWTLKESKFIPEALFPEPLALTWSKTHGANLMWVPIPFEQSFRMMYGYTYYGTGYYIYHLIDPAAPLSQPIKTWDGRTPPDPAVLELLGRAGTDLVPQADSPEGRVQAVREQSGRLALADKATVELARLEGGPSALRALNLSVPRRDALAFGRATLRITWDDSPHASIEAPVALFFGAGTLYNRDDREYLVKALPVNIRYDAERVHLACYFPMPFASRARIELVGAGEVADVQWSLRYSPWTEPAEQLAYFHATYRDHPSESQVLGEDMVLLDTRRTEGGGDWSGHFVGTSFIFSHRNVLRTLEGDPRFFFDDSQSPQAYGTGTEEWGGGGDYWGGKNMTLPLAGHPVGAPKAEQAREAEDQIQSAYRFLLADLMPFGKTAVIRLEHGASNNSFEHYETVTYWYGANRATLVKSDSLQISDPASEAAHAYHSPEASAPYEIESRYEWGVDTIQDKVIYPPHRDRGRRTTGSSEFTLNVDAENFGVLLRRKLDYQFPNQRAEVSVAPVHEDGRVGEFRGAGVWYLAGSNTCLFSKAKEELDPPGFVTQTSNRRFRDDEFLLSRELTRGHSRIRVRLRFTPVDIPLQPGLPLPERAWTELRYDAYNYIWPARRTSPVAP